ncbi:MAG: DUF6691 family protein [Chromatiales bacterium]
MKIPLAAFVCGLLFALGLGIAGMTQPEKIIGFLDVTGRWDPDLLWVMAAAISVTALGYRWTLRRDRPLVEAVFYLPKLGSLDVRLIAGSALFGVGWGLGGFCPGPALTSMVSGLPTVWVFVLAMAVGMKIYQGLSRRGVREAALRQDA